MRNVRKLALSLGAVVILGAVMAASASAITNPTKSLKILENCPTGKLAENGLPANLCVFGATELGEGGHYTVGGITVQLTKQIILQYGIARNRETEEEFYVPPSHGVEAIKPTPEAVPGTPIANITPAEQEELGWPEGLKARYKEGQKDGAVKKVVEEIELAGIPVTSRFNLLAEEGPVVIAPVKIKGENKWISELGDVCYIGSNAEPIVQHLTAGESESPLTHEKIKGHAGEIQASHEFEFIAVPKTLLVDNTYPVPGASCTGPYSTQIAATIDKKFGIPAPAGASETMLNGTLYNATTVLAEKAGF